VADGVADFMEHREVEQRCRYRLDPVADTHDDGAHMPAVRERFVSFDRRLQNT